MRNQQEKSAVDQQSQVVSLKNLLHQEPDILQLLKGPEKEIITKTEIKLPVIKLTVSVPDEDAVLPKVIFYIRGSQNRELY